VTSKNNFVDGYGTGSGTGSGYGDGYGDGDGYGSGDGSGDGSGSGDGAHPQVPLTEEEIDGIYLEVVGPEGGKLSRAFARASIVCTRGIGEKK